jgi:hypothetical protein
LFITEVETEVEVEKLPDMTLALRTEVIDLERTEGTRFRITDPSRLLSSK